MTKLPIPRRTKIVCTMGPACAGAVLAQLLAAGMNVARLNFSHGSREEHAGRIKRLRELSEQLRLPVAILQDLAGPKVRIGEVPGGEVTLKDGEEFALSAGPLRQARPALSSNYPAGYRRDSGGRAHPAGRWQHRTPGRDQGRSGPQLPGGGGWGITLPGGDEFPLHSPSVPAFTHKDREDLRFGIAQGVDFIALSYVRSAQDVLEAREFIRGLGAEHPHHRQDRKTRGPGAASEEILEAADGLMVARGDLGVEVPLERVPLLQKQIIAAANRAGKPVITATQMLLSMVDHSRPSRAEATDVANAILDGTDAVMLSEETAAGHYPVEAVKFLDQVSRATEGSFPYTAWLRSRAAEGRGRFPSP